VIDHQIDADPGRVMHHLEVRDIAESPPYYHRYIREIKLNGWNFMKDDTTGIAVRAFS